MGFAKDLFTCADGQSYDIRRVSCKGGGIKPKQR
jgi:hypothetical protein